MFIELTQGEIADPSTQFKTLLNVNGISHVEPFVLGDAELSAPIGADVYLLDGNVVTVIQSYLDVKTLICGCSDMALRN